MASLAAFSSQASGYYAFHIFSESTSSFKCQVQNTVTVAAAALKSWGVLQLLRINSNLMTLAEKEAIFSVAT